jgi:protein gp37
MLPDEWIEQPRSNVWLGTTVETDTWIQRILALLRIPAVVHFLSIEPILGPMPNLPLDGINWVIVGGESGQKYRTPDPNWILSIRDQCVRAGVSFFFKQWGGPTAKSGGRILDGRTWDELPSIRRGEFR